MHPARFLHHRVSTQPRSGSLRKPRSRLGTTAINNDGFGSLPGLQPFPRFGSPSSGCAPRKQSCRRLQCRGFMGPRVRDGTPEVGGFAEPDGRSKEGAAEGEAGCMAPHRQT